MRADFLLDYDAVTVKQSRTLHLLARFVSDPAPQDHTRRGLNLSVVIDRSGSMAGEKLDFTRQAAQFLVQNLGIEDILSIVLYNDKVETLLMPEKVRRKDAINQRVGAIKASGTTNLSGGWLEGCNLVAQNLNDDYVNRVILMSDGLANRGVTDQDKLVALAQQKRSEHITTTTMGLGNDFNEDLLMAMASAGGGAFYFIESPEVTPLIFQEELKGLLNVVGQNLTITIEPSDQISVVTQMNAYPMHTDGKRMSFRLGDIFGDEVKALLLELSLPAFSETGHKQIATLYFEYDVLGETSTEHRTVELPVFITVVTPDEQQLPESVNPEVRQTVFLLQAAQARQRAVKAADKGQYETAAQTLREAADAMDGYTTDDPRLQEEQAALRQQAAEVEKGASQYNVYSRKSMSTQAFYTMTSRHEDTVSLRVREHQREPGNTPKSGEDDPIKVEKREGVTPTHVTWKGRSFQLNGNLIRIGRSKHNDIIILASGVSRFHCHIRREGDKLILEDLGSTNGTMLGGVVLDEPHVLSVGDVAYLCDEKLVFHDNPKGT